MNNIKNLSAILILSTSLSLIGCDEKVQTVEWYKAHEKERKEMVATCNSKLKDTPNCKNAREAEIAAIWNNPK